MMKKLLGLFACLVFASTAFAQGTQISRAQLKDGIINDIKVDANALISHTKINFTGMTASIVNAENPLTFGTPLSRTANTITLTVVPVTLGGTGLTTVAAGRIPFGNSASQLGTSANLSFDNGTNAFTVTGSGHFTTTLLVGGGLTVAGTTVTSFNGKAYVFPSAASAAGSVLTDAAGNGTLSWATASSPSLLGFNGITRPSRSGPIPTAQLWNVAASLQDELSNDASEKALLWSDTTVGYVAQFFSQNATAAGNGLFVSTLSDDITARIFTAASNGTDRLVLYGDGTLHLPGVFNVGTVNSSIESALNLYGTVSAGGAVKATKLSAPTNVSVSNIGTPGSATWSYEVVALLFDGSHTEVSSVGTTSTGNDTLTGSNYNQITWDLVTGASGYDVYRTVVGTSPATTGKITPTPLQQGSGNGFDDTGLAGDSGSAPTTNSTGASSATWFTTIVGTPIADAATIAPNASIVHITGTGTPIATITTPYTGFVGQVTLIADDGSGFTTTTGGNIALGSTVAQNKALILIYDGTSWFPIY